MTNIYGFSSNEIRTLINENVTRNSLVNQLSWFLDKLKEGDVLLFYFSGYGSMVRVQEFDGEKHEDHFEEALCLYDIDFRNPDTFLLDDEFNCYNQSPQVYGNNKLKNQKFLSRKEIQ